MKYLEKYKLFESSKSVDMDIIKDIFIDLEDEGFLVETYPSGFNDDDRIRIVITKQGGDVISFPSSFVKRNFKFNSNEVKDCVDRLISYSKQCSRFIDVLYTYRCGGYPIHRVEFVREFPINTNIEMFMIDVVFKTWWKKLIQNPY